MVRLGWNLVFSVSTYIRTQIPIVSWLICLPYFSRSWPRRWCRWWRGEWFWENWSTSRPHLVLVCSSRRQASSGSTPDGQVGRGRSRERGGGYHHVETPLVRICSTQLCFNILQIHRTTSACQQHHKVRAGQWTWPTAQLKGSPKGTFKFALKE